jgi:hypothetical protein
MLLSLSEALEISLSHACTYLAQIAIILPDNFLDIFHPHPSPCPPTHRATYPFVCLICLICLYLPAHLPTSLSCSLCIFSEILSLLRDKLPTRHFRVPYFFLLSFLSLFRLMPLLILLFISNNDDTSTSAFQIIHALLDVSIIPADRQIHLYGFPQKDFF